MNKTLLLIVFLFSILIVGYGINIERMKNISSVMEYNDLKVQIAIPRVVSRGRFGSARTYDVTFKSPTNTIKILGLTIPFSSDTRYTIKTVKVGSSHCLKSINVNSMALKEIDQPLSNCKTVTLL